MDDPAGLQGLLGGDMEVTVGPADVGNPDTRRQLVRMARGAVAEKRDARGGSIWSLREAAPVASPEVALDALGERDRAFLGCVEGVAVGFAIVRTDRLADGSMLGMIDVLYVEPGFREVGVGEALMEQILAWARENDCVGIDGLALPGDRHTKNFFESFGFKARLLVVHRDLSGG